jgi:hypothetical protein
MKSRIRPFRFLLPSAIAIVVGCQVARAEEVVYRLATDGEAAADIAAWAVQSTTGPKGRPLPLAGNWMCENQSDRRPDESPLHWGPEYMMELTRGGHHVLISFVDSFSVAHWRYVAGSERHESKVIAYKQHWLPVLEYCRDNRLPIAIRGWNWDTYPITYQDAKMRSGSTIPADQDVRLFDGGQPTKYTDPMGPIDAWRETGAFWLGNPLAQWMREIYPDPPMVILLNNNEAGKIHSAEELATKGDRYRAAYGDDASRAANILSSGYLERRQAMYDAARDAAGLWSKVLRFVAYNNLWNTMEVGRKQIDWPADGYPLPEPWDGGMLELYDNDWQPGKADFRPWSMQAEAMNCAGVLPDIFRQNPDFFWSTITWDGERPASVYRPRGNPVAGTGKVYYYITRGQRWDHHRLEGWAQFGLWVQRPRLAFEFRGNPARSAYDDLTWQTMVRMVDRPWNHPVLREFWQYGELVPNRKESPFWPLKGDQPEWLQKLDRWFLLTSSANPPRPEIKAVTDSAEAGQRLPDEIVEEDVEWNQYTRIAVWAVALKLAKTPSRWLIYAHAPLGDVRDSTLRLPEYGEVAIDVIPVSGSFFLVEEATNRVQTLVAGTPGQCGTFWERPEEVPDARVYDLPLDETFAWQGPWDAADDDPLRLVTYRHLPNRGVAPPAVLTGGRFVDDSERGRVLELTGGQDGIWLIADKNTVMASPGHADRTISFWIRPTDVQSRQVLYAEGNLGVGLNIHLDGGRIHAGAWAPADALAWEGVWVSSPEIAPDTWTQVALVLEDAATSVQPDRFRLYINGRLAGAVPGVQMPKCYTPPRLGQPVSNWRGVPMTRFVRALAKKESVAGFRGRFDDFLMVNEAVKP